MPANSRIQSFKFLTPAKSVTGAGSQRIEVTLQDATMTSFYVATPDQARLWIEKAKKGFSFGPPVLFVRTLAEPVVREALDYMAEDMGGYWLRYYNSLHGLSGAVGRGKPSRSRKAKVSLPKLKVMRVVLREVEPPKSPASASAVVEIIVKDGREFTVLAATPSWFESRFDEIGAQFYYGSSILFLSKLQAALAKKAATEMAEGDGRWLCVHDTPRTTLPKVMARFMQPSS